MWQLGHDSQQRMGESEVTMGSQASIHKRNYAGRATTALVGSLTNSPTAQKNTQTLKRSLKGHKRSVSNYKTLMGQNSQSKNRFGTQRAGSIATETAPLDPSLMVDTFQRNPLERNKFNIMSS